MTKYLYQNLRHGLIGAWCPSQGSTGHRLLDRSGYNNHGTFTNLTPSTSWVAGGGDITIRGNNESNAGILFSAQTFSRINVSMWMLFHSSVVSQNYLFQIIRVGFSSPLSITTNGSSLLSYSVSGSGITTSVLSSAALTTNRWYHIYGQLDGTTLSLYLDGNLQNTATHNGGYVTSTNDGMSTCGTAGGGTNAPRIMIDDIRTYSRTLCTGEIATLATRRGIAYETIPTRYRMRGAGGGPPATFKGRNMLVGCAI